MNEEKELDKVGFVEEEAEKILDLLVNEGISYALIRNVLDYAKAKLEFLIPSNRKG